MPPLYLCRVISPPSCKTLQSHWFITILPLKVANWWYTPCSDTPKSPNPHCSMPHSTDPIARLAPWRFPSLSTNAPPRGHGQQCGEGNSWCPVHLLRGWRPVKPWVIEWDCVWNSLGRIRQNMGFCGIPWCHNQFQTKPVFGSDGFF